MTTIRWTDQAIADLDAIHAFIEQDSPHYASVVVARVIRAVDRLSSPNRAELFQNSNARRSAKSLRPYRIIYRLVQEDEIHILAVHHGAKHMPDSV